MKSVASLTPAGKAAPSVSPSSAAVDSLLVRIGAETRPAAARHFLRFAHRRLGPQAPALPAENLRALAAAVLSLPGATEQGVCELAEQALTALASASPAIQVDNLLRGTLATDMPADVRSTLRALAGHADSERGEAWPERETLAGEAGVGLGRLDKILELLAELHWVQKTKRTRPQGGKAPSVWTLTPMSGVWGWTAIEVKRRKRDAPPPQTKEVRAARAAAKAAELANGSETVPERFATDVASGASSQCPTGRIIAMSRPAHHSDVAPRASESIPLERPSQAPKEGAGEAPSIPPPGGSTHTGEKVERKESSAAERHGEAAPSGDGEVLTGESEEKVERDEPPASGPRRASKAAPWTIPPHHVAFMAHHQLDPAKVLERFRERHVVLELVDAEERGRLDRAFAAVVVGASTDPTMRLEGLAMAAE